MSDADFVGGSEDLQQNNTVCGMNFTKANEDDIGGWTCEIEQCTSSCKNDGGSGTKANATIYVTVRHH